MGQALCYKTYLAADLARGKGPIGREEMCIKMLILHVMHVFIEVWAYFKDSKEGESEWVDGSQRR